MTSIALPFTQSRVISEIRIWPLPSPRISSSCRFSCGTLNITPYKSAILLPSPKRLSGAQSEGVSLVSSWRSSVIAPLTPSGEKPVESASSATPRGMSASLRA